MNLADKIQYLKGVGPNLALKLAKLEIKTIKDLFYYFPKYYEDRTKITKLCDLAIGQDLFVFADLASVYLEKKARVNILEATVEQSGYFLNLIWFNQEFLLKILQQALTKKQKIFAKGKIVLNNYSNSLQMQVKDFELIDSKLEQGLSVLRIVPFYSLTKGISQKKLRTLINYLLEEYLNLLQDFLPKLIREKYQLLNLKEAILNLHFPKNRALWLEAKYTMVFLEFFMFYLALKEANLGNIKSGISFKPSQKLYLQYLASLPFKLTKDQKKAIQDIFTDMQKPVQMQRLLQGDVGSGKTEVAIATILNALENGYQAVLMAPTEILAEQHYYKIKTQLQRLDLACLFLSSGVKQKEKAIIKQELASGKASLVIGTHALIQEDIDFKNLGLVVIDEQHRFGVKQRAMLMQKGYNPDWLIMTATPIPRTLAISLYSDLDQSIIKEMPLNRKPIKTFFIDKHNQTKIVKMYQFIKQKIAQEKQQVYFVYPLIEATEKKNLKAVTQELENLKLIFPDYKIALLHGKMKREAKEAVMNDFKAGNINILISTTVIEVGIDIANANIIVIENAERFGLSQLHQLRGRVGRANFQGFCFLIGEPKTQEGAKRISAMLKTSDGFEISELDLEIRGPGEILGLRQSGMPEFKLADILKDQKIMLKAKEAVLDLNLKEYEALIKIIGVNKADLI